MSLIGRLMAADEAGGRRKIAIVHLIGGLRLLRAGKLTKARMVADLQLDAGEATDLDALIVRLQASGDPRSALEAIYDVLAMAERGIFNLDTEAKVASAIAAVT